MNFKEYLDQNEKNLQNMKFENIDQLKKFADKENISYSEEELKQAWRYIKGQSSSEDGSLDEDALDAVAGGKNDTTRIYKHNKRKDYDYSKSLDTGGGSIGQGVNMG